jgi:hypothetical protein
MTPEIEKQLLSISPVTIDRRFKNKKYRIKKRIYSSTGTAYLLKSQIPVRTDNWYVNEMKIYGSGFSVSIVVHQPTLST